MKKLIGIASLLLAVNLVFGQSLVLDNERTSMSIDGTSSLHDWVIIVQECSGKAAVSKDATKVNEISSLSFSAKSKSLDSGKSGMDKNTYNALKADEYPTIDFKLKSVESIKPSVDGKGFIVRATGDLTIAGKTNSEDLKVYSIVLEDGSVRFKGSLEFPMTKYGVDPPTALMGTISTGDDVKINFSVVYN